jgi:hypothetical protein
MSMWSVPAMFGSAMWPRYPNYTRHRRWNRESPRSKRGCQTSIDYLVWVITISSSWNNYKSYGYMLKLSQPYILHLRVISQPCWITGGTVYCCIVGCLPHQVYQGGFIQRFWVVVGYIGYIPSTSQCAMSWRHGFWSSQHGIHGIPQFRYESWWMQARPLWANINPYGQNSQFAAKWSFSRCAHLVTGFPPPEKWCSKGTRGSLRRLG